MNYLNKLIECLRGIFLEKTDKFVRRAPTPNETVSHFIFVKDHIYAQDKRAKPAAFKPHSRRRDFSVYRIDQCDESLIWHLGKKYVQNKRPDKKPLIARADFKLDIPIKHNLHLNADGKPHKRHLNIEQWPSNSKMIETDIANSATTHFI